MNRSGATIPLKKAEDVVQKYRAQWLDNFHDAKSHGKYLGALMVVNELRKLAEKSR